MNGTPSLLSILTFNLTGMTEEGTQKRLLAMLKQCLHFMDTGESGLAIDAFSGSDLPRHLIDNHLKIFRASLRNSAENVTRALATVQHESKALSADLDSLTELYSEIAAYASQSEATK